MQSLKIFSWQCNSNNVSKIHACNMIIWEQHNKLRVCTAGCLGTDLDLWLSSLTQFILTECPAPHTGPLYPLQTSRWSSGSGTGAIWTGIKGCVKFLHAWSMGLNGGDGDGVEGRALGRGRERERAEHSQQWLTNERWTVWIVSHYQST